MSDPVIKIFISFSFQEFLANSENRKLKDWAADFKSRLPKLTGYSGEEIYLYPDARLGADIPAEVRRSLETAEHFICIISDQYLQSPWCVDEFRLFTSRPATDRAKPLFVFTPFLVERAYSNVDIFKRTIKQGIEWMEDKNSEFSTKLKPFAESEWAKSITEAHSKHGSKRSLDLRNDDWRSAARPLSEYLRRPRTEFLLDYAAISAYCLGADRYLSGGWGFSVPQVDEHQQGDNDIAVPNSSHALNAVILRALHCFFTNTDSEIVEQIGERQDAFDAKGLLRNPFQAVQDRLPLFARLLACMAVDQAGEGDLQEHAKVAFGALEGFDFSSRWTLALDKGLHTEEYYVALLVCLSKAKEMKDANNRRYWPKLEASVSPHLGSLKTVKKLAEGAIEDSDLFEMLDAGPNSELTGTLEEAARASIRWLMLGECHDGRDLLRARVASKQFPRERLAGRIQDGITKCDAAVITMATVASLTAIPPDVSDPADIPGSAKFVLDVLYSYLFKAIDGAMVVPTLNAVAWAAIILIAAHESKFSASDKELLRNCWERGRALRQNRLEAISTLAQKADEFDRAKLDEKIHSLIASDASWCLDCLPRFERSLVVEASPEYRAQEFTQLLHDATFWGQRIIGNPPPLTSSQSLGGVLRVGLENKQVELDSPGYRKMFLEPFTALTGINVRNLNGIKREFGGLDDTLVKFMGEIVVRKVYIPSANGYIWDAQTTFEQRTNEIIEALFEAEDVANGMDDLLLVKRGKGPEEFRWIHRSAIVQGPRRQGGSRLISWRFVEMSPVAEKMTSDAKAEEMTSDAKTA
jgi:hypothetical protein